MMDTLQSIRFDIDSQTYVLIAIVAALGLIRWSVFSLPDPLTHPLILGRQAEPSPVRHAGESPIWMNGLSVGRGTVARPDATSRTVGDIVAKENGAREKGEAMATGLRKLLPRAKGGEARTIAVMLPNSEETLQTLLAISLLSPACTALVVPPEAPREASAAIARSSSSLAAVVTTPQLLGLLMTALPGPGGELVLIVVGASEKPIERAGYRVYSLESVLEHGRNPRSPIVADSTDAAGSTPSPSDVFIQLVASSPDGKFSTVPITHQNFTAAVHALNHIAPALNRFSSSDTFLSFISPRRPVGLSIALSAAHSGAPLTLAPLGPEDGVEVLAACKHLRPSILFITPRQAHALSTLLKDLGIQAFVANDGLYQRALLAKNAHLRAGFVGPHWIWDRVMFAQIRKETALDRMRLVVVVSEDADQPSQSAMDVLRIHLSCPVVSTLAHPTLPTLIAAAHPFDLQLNDERERGPMDTPNVHVGAGVVNLEIKLVVDGGESAFKAQEQRGRLNIRGPGVPSSDPKAWFDTGIDAHIRPNGTIIVHQTL